MKATSNSVKNIRIAMLCLAIGVFLYLIGWSGNLALSLIISFGIGFTIRYGKIWLSKIKPDMKLWIQYLLVSTVAILFWGLLPITLFYQLTQDTAKVSISEYAIVLLICSTIVAMLSYLYYKNEQFHLLQQALSEAEIAHIKQDKEMLVTKLRLLQSQIEPHFLFNTLANIQALINIDPRMANKMLTALTSMLRQSLNRTRDEWLTLSHELRFNKAYLAIQQIRLGDRLRINFEISDKIVDTLLFPPMLIQPLIENAVIHGIEPLAEGGEITLKVSISDHILDICIINDCSVEPQPSNHHGHNVGVSNIKERLSQLYADKGQFNYDDTTQGKVIVTMKVPLNV